MPKPGCYDRSPGPRTSGKPSSKKEQSLIRYGQNLESSFLKEEQRLNEELIRKITSYIEQYAQQNNYDYVFGYSLATVAAGIIYGDQAYNITNEIVAGLNAGADK
ncbi:MAG: OmpH family outer membrane protein [Bacteroidia bacterium]|nr:OmpH family outer membrane protein [Bacteroidia bacterium]